MNKIKVCPKITLCSAVITSLIILFFSGMAIAEKNTKLIGFGETGQYINFKEINDQKIINIKFIGQEYNFDITKIYNIYKSIKDIKILKKMPNLQIENKILQKFKIDWYQFPFFSIIKQIVFEKITKK